MSKIYESAKVCKLLGIEARTLLIRASQVKTDKDPLARVKAVEKAMALARAYQPWKFN